MEVRHSRAYAILKSSNAKLLWIPSRTGFDIKYESSKTITLNEDSSRLAKKTTEPILINQLHIKHHEIAFTDNSLPSSC
jgi:hypothetical protein